MVNSSFSGSQNERRLIDEVVSSQRFPKGLTRNYKVEFGEDSTGQPSVWIRLVVDDEHQNPTTTWIVEVRDFVAILRKELLEKPLSHWPYIELTSSTH